MATRKSKRKMDRREFLKKTGAVTGLAMLAPIIEACARAPTPTTVPPTATPVPPTGTAVPPTPTPEVEAVAPWAASGEIPEQTLTVGYYAGPDADAHLRLGPLFTDYTQGKVTVEVDAIDRQTYDAKLTTAMQSGEEIWGVMVGLNLALKQMVEAGWIEPLDDYMADPKLLNAALYDYEDFPQAARDLVTYEGKTYMIPVRPSVPMLFYRRDILEKYGVEPPPEEGWSWDVLRENALTIQEGLTADGESGVYAFCLGGKPSHAALLPLMGIWSWGEEVFDEAFQPHFDTPGAIEAVQFMLDLVLKDEVVSPGMPGYEYPEILVALQEGKAAMAIQWDAAIQTLNDPEASPNTAGKMGYSLFPWEKSAGPEHPRVFPAIDCLAIPSTASQKEVAFEYIVWFSSKDMAREIVRVGFPGRASLGSDPEILEIRPSFPTEAKSVALYHSLPDLTQNLYIIFAILNPNWNAMFTGQVSAEEANKKINEEITAYLKEEGVL